VSEIADRYRNVALAFTERVREVPDERWDDPAPCEGWVARDVVRHLVEWFPMLLRDGSGLQVEAGPSIDDDPVAAWTVMSDGVQGLLDDPEVAAQQFSHPMAGDHRLDAFVDSFFTSDVLVHTWDLARATGLDEHLDPGEVSGMLGAMVPLDDMLRASGHYGPRVDVGDDADDQTKLLAFLGRRP